MTTEDQRQAAAIKVSISNYVGTATLALLAGAAALYTYVEQNFDNSWLFDLLMIAAVIALVASFILGGKGADSTASKLAKGAWNESTRTPDFNSQAVLTLLGLVLLLTATGFGVQQPHVSTQDPCLRSFSKGIMMRKPNLEQLGGDLYSCEEGRS